VALEGSVKDFGIVDIFQLIAMQKKTGLLTLSDGARSILVSFTNGNLVNAVEGDEGERFSNALISAERISLTQFRSALRMKEKNVSIGDVFIKLAYLTPQEVREWNQTLTQETVFDLLSWETGSYRFDPQEILFKPDCYTPVSVERTLMEGMRQKDEWPALLKKIPSKKMVFQLVSNNAQNGGGSFDTPMDTEELNWLLKWIDGSRNVESLVMHGGVGAFPVYKCLRELLVDGRIQVKEIVPERKKSRISLPSIKEIIHASLVFLDRSLTVSIIILLISFFIPSLYGRPSISERIGAFFSATSQFSSGNHFERVRFYLDLYYMRYNRYPDALGQLKSSRLLDSDEEAEIDLNAFIYRRNGKSYELTLKTK
jgi:hypothetical protein